MSKRAIKNRKIDAFYSVRMANTWTHIFDLSTEEKVEKFTKYTEKEIYLLIGLPGYIYSPWDGYQIFAGDVYNKYQRAIFEELPIFSIYYSNYK